MCQYMRFRHFWHVLRLRIQTRYTARLFVSDVWLAFGRISKKEGFRHVFMCIIKALTNTDVPVRLAHFTHSASIFKIERPKVH